jgi:hypothetical protein
MNQKITILYIIILLLEYPLLLLKGDLKKTYSKLLKKKLQNLKNLIQERENLDKIIEAFNETQKILNNFIQTKQNEFSKDHELFLKELNKWLLLVNENLLSENSNIFYDLSFNFILEKLKQNSNLNNTLKQSKKNAHQWENKAYAASQYGSDLNRELEHITGDVINLLKTIKTLKAQLTLEESRSEILAEEKKVLTKELAIEKEKKF